MILISLASKQIWPQVLTVAHLKPDRLFLIHSNDKTESQGPAQRLKRFFDNSGLIPKGGTRLEVVPDSEFNAIELALDTLQTSYQLPLDDCAVNFTGGNKLMATAAFRWSDRRGVKSFYLERRNLLTRFEPRDGDIHTRTETLDGHITDSLDPVALLRCQLDASEVERAGQTIELNEDGRGLPEADFFRRIQNGNDARPWLRVQGEADREPREGDRLEFASAAVLLKLGVLRVQRGLRLKVRSGQGIGTRLPHVEIDLLFTWAGRLWLVDCKDRMPAEDLVKKLRHHLPHPIDENADQLLGRIQEELAISQTKVMKEDLLAVREAGGLLGSVVCVRKAGLPEEVVQFARYNQIELVRKNNLVEGFRDLLSPNRPADTGDLAALPAHFKP